MANVIYEKTDTFNTKKIITASGFIELYKNKIDNLFLYQNGLMENFSTDPGIIDFLNNPKEKEKEKIVVKDSFIKELNAHMGKISAFELKITTINNREGEEGFKFFLKENTTELSLRKNRMYVPTKNLIIRKDPGKDKIEIKNIEQVFMKSNFNVVDFSKTLVDSDFYNNTLVKKIIKPTSDLTLINENEGLKKYNNIEFEKILKSLEGNLKLSNQKQTEVEIETSEKQKIKKQKIINVVKDVFFSKTIGFSIKSLTINDINDLKIIGSNIIEKEFKDVQIANTNSISNVSVGGFDKNIGALRLGTKTIKKEFYKIKNISNLKNEIENSNYTLSYFSPFKSKGEDTCVKLTYSTDCDIEIFQNKNNPLDSNVLLKNIRLVPKENVTVMEINELIEHLAQNKNRHRISEIHRFNNPKLYNELNKEIEKNSSNIDIITDVSILNGYLVIITKFTLVETLEDIVFKSETFKNAHVFIPKICLETVNGPAGLLDLDTELSSIVKISRKDALEKIKNTDVTSNVLTKSNISDSETVGHDCTYVYKIKLSEIFKHSQIKSSEMLRSLSPLYGIKYFFTDRSDFKSNLYDEVSSFENKNITTLYPKFQPTFGLKELNVDNQKRVNEDFSFISNQTTSLSSSSSEQDEPEVDNSLTNDPEDVLKVSEKDAQLYDDTSLKSAGPVNLNSFESIKSAAEARKKINENGIIKSYFELNNISEEKPRGYVTSLKEYEYLKYHKNYYFNAFIARRGNVQPKLLALINKAVEQTKEQYSSLLNAQIMSGSTMPPDLWVEVVDLVRQYRDTQNKEYAVSLFKNAGFYHVNNKNINETIKSLLERGGSGPDTNHSLGFAADVFLERQYSDGTKKLICLYDPHDDEDFKIVKFFIDRCFKLGVNNIGAGRFYMDYPKYAKYEAKKTHPKYKYIKEHNGKFIIDENNVPLRVVSEKSPKANAIHIDIVSQNPVLDAIIEKGNEDKYNKIVKYLSRYSEIVKNKKLSKDETLKTEIRIMQSIKYKAKQSRGVWGEDKTTKTAEAWLLELKKEGSGSNAKGKYKESTEITKENTKTVGFELFKLVKKKQLKKFAKHGSSESDAVGYVNESILLKEEAKK